MKNRKKNEKIKMSGESENIAYASIDSAAQVASATDVEMVNASDSSGAKNIRNVQTQHGDYRSVDEENIFLIARCLWPEEEEEEKDPSLSEATTSNDTKQNEQEEQVVWIEPFADEVSYFNYSLNCVNFETD